MLHFQRSWNRTFSSNHGLNITFHSITNSILPSLILYSLHYATVKVNIGGCHMGLEHTDPRLRKCHRMRQIDYGLLSCTE